MKNNQYPKYLILATDIMNNRQHNDFGTINIEHKI